MADNLNGASGLNEAYQYARECLDWLAETVRCFDPDIDAQLGRRACDGLGEHEVKMLSFCYPLQQWIDAGPLPEILVTVHTAPIERLGIVAPCVHQLVKELVGNAVLRVCEAVRPGSTRDFSPFWGCSEIPSLGYVELENADRFAVSAAIRLEPLHLGATLPGGPGPLHDEDFTWLAAALSQEYARAKQLLLQVDPPAATAHDPPLIVSLTPS